MHELKKLFLVMITAPSESVTPEKSLVILALLNESQYGILESSSTDQPMQNGTDHLPVMDGRPVYGPLPMPKPNEEDKLLHHSGSSTDVAMTDAESAATTLDPFSDPKDQEQKKEQDGAGQEQTDTVMADQLPAAPSHPPPPVPPRPKAVAQEKSMLQRAEAVAQQQDAAEILNNIFDLIRCAMKPEGLLEEGEQKDRITEYVSPILV
jgi:ubiquitin carboxyl-terminal hydrolase 25/28